MKIINKKTSKEYLTNDDNYTINKDKGELMETLPVKQNIKPKNTDTIKILLAILFCLGFVYLGMRIEQSRQPVRLPANEACLTYGSQTVEYYQNRTARIFDDTIQEKPIDIKKLREQCENTKTKYEING